MKKVFFILGFILILMTSIVYLPQKWLNHFPMSSQKTLINLRHKIQKILPVNKSDAQQTATQQTASLQKSEKMYRYKDKNGKTVYSDLNKKKAKQHHLDKSNSVFIDMKAGQPVKDSEKNQPKSTGAKGILDPINSINNEAKRNVKKMQQAKDQKLAEQGI